MILLCDEDIGTRVPKALQLVRHHAKSLVENGNRCWSDENWLELAGDKGWLVFTANKKMLKVPLERKTIVDHKVGIIFLTNGEEHIDNVLRLLLTKWEWLEFVDKNEIRPFAYFLYPRGQTKKQSLS